MEINIHAIEGYETYIESTDPILIGCRPKWIKCSERLPTTGITCLLYITYPEGTMMNCRADPLTRTNVHIGGILYNGKFSDLHNQFEYKELKYVSHWMPLPTPPKE